MSHEICAHQETPQGYWCDLPKGHSGGHLAHVGGVDHKWGNHDPVNHPAHYTQRGVECITVTEHMNFCLGNAMKYLWRAGSKGDTVEDLRKAIWYIEREISRLTKGK